MLIGNELIEDVVLDPHEITHDIRRFNLETDAAVIIKRREFLKFINLKIRMNISMLNFMCYRGIQQGDVDHIIFIQDFTGNAQGFGHESNSTDAAAFTVTAVMHLHRRFENILTGYRNGTDKSCYAAAAFLFGICGEVRHLIIQFRAGS